MYSASTATALSIISSCTADEDLKWLRDLTTAADAEVAFRTLAVYCAVENVRSLSDLDAQPFRTLPWYLEFHSETRRRLDRCLSEARLRAAADVAARRAGEATPIDARAAAPERRALIVMPDTPRSAMTPAVPSPLSREPAECLRGCLEDRSVLIADIYLYQCVGNRW